MTAWTETLDAKLTELRAQGLSFSQCAGLINHKFGTTFTRNATIGRATRIGTPRVSRPFAINRRPRRQKLTRMIARGVPIVPDAKPIIPFSPEHQCQILALGNENCRFPMFNDEAPQKLFCGTPSADFLGGRPYCAFHADICFNGVPEQRPRKFSGWLGWGA